MNARGVRGGGGGGGEENIFENNTPLFVLEEGSGGLYVLEKIRHVFEICDPLASSPD